MSNHSMDMEDGQKSSMMMPTTGGHTMHPDDPENPQNFALLKKLHASASAFGFAFTVYMLSRQY